MPRAFRYAVAGLGVLTLASSFAVASYALGSDPAPQPRPNLPAGALPTISLDERTSVQINDLIGVEGRERFGITRESYTKARRLADTRVGTFYLIPGVRGTCISSLLGVACGDPGVPDQPMLALSHATPEGDAVVGVGVAASGITRVTLPLTTGTISAPVSGGVFQLHARLSFDPDTGPLLHED